MEAFLRTLGSPDESIVESLARNDVAALSAAVAGTAEWTPVAEDVRAPSLWYEGSKEDPFGENYGETLLVSLGSLTSAFGR